MCTQKFSLRLAGLIWILVGIKIGSKAIAWLEPYYNPPNWQLVFILVSLVLGFLKARTVLRKAVARSLDNVTKVGKESINYLTGWLKLFGLRGVIVIALMIGLGIFLRYIKASGFDPYNLMGFLYLAVAFGLIGASSYYFIAANDHKDCG